MSKTVQTATTKSQQCRLSHCQNREVYTSHYSVASCTANDIYQYLEKYEVFTHNTPLFTDSSKQNNHAATAVVLNSQNVTKRLTNSAFVYTAGTSHYSSVSSKTSYSFC